MQVVDCRNPAQEQSIYVYSFMVTFVALRRQFIPSERSSLLYDREGREGEAQGCSGVRKYKKHKPIRVLYSVQCIACVRR